MKYGPPVLAINAVVVALLGWVFLVGGLPVLGWIVLAGGSTTAVIAFVLRLRHNRRWLERAIAEDDAAERAD